MKPLSQNNALYKGLRWFMIGLIAMVFEIIPVGDALEIVPFPGFTVRYI